MTVCWMHVVFLLDSRHNSEPLKSEAAQNLTEEAASNFSMLEKPCIVNVLSDL